MHSEISFLLTFPNLRSGRARLSYRHTSSCSLVRRQQKPTHRRVTLCFFLTGPHTFTAISSLSQAPAASLSGGARTQVNDAVKASVPKLFSCPGASASSPLSGSSRRNVASRQLRKPTTPVALASPAVGLLAWASLPCAQSITITPRWTLRQEKVSSVTAALGRCPPGSHKKSCSKGCSLENLAWEGPCGALEKQGQNRPRVSDLSMGRAAPMPR